MKPGINKVHFYNHKKPYVMKFDGTFWFCFNYEQTPHDEIDFHERPPVWICDLEGDQCSQS